MKRILLTSFEPFGGSSLNSSHEVAQGISARPPAGVEIDWLVVPVVAWECVEKVWARVVQTRPDVLLSLGQAGGAAAVRLEDRAVNIDNFPIPDNAGNWRKWEWIAEDGPGAYLANFPRRQIGQALQQAGIPFEYSFSAGSYVCNHLYYGLLHRSEQARGSHQIGFIHLPLLPEQVPAGQKWPSLPREVLIEGVRRAISVCAGVAD